MLPDVYTSSSVMTSLQVRISVGLEMFSLRYVKKGNIIEIISLSPTRLPLLMQLDIGNTRILCKLFLSIYTPVIRQMLDILHEVEGKSSQS